MKALKVYVEQMRSCGYVDGHALYHPEDEVNIGDIGFLEATNGRFRRLFNCTLPADNPVNVHGVPNGYWPLILDAGHIRVDDQYLPEGILHSASVVKDDVDLDAKGGSTVTAGAGISYSCYEQAGAILKYGSRLSRVEISDNEDVENYMKKHVDSWYELAVQRGYGPKQAPEGSIFLVRGCDKTPEFTLAAYWDSKKEGAFNIFGGSDGIGARFRFHASKEHSDVPQCRSGRPWPEFDSEHPGFDKQTPSPSPPVNEAGCAIYPFFARDCRYTVFLRMYTIKRPLRIVGLRAPRWLRAGAGPHQLPRAPPSDDTNAAAISTDQDMEMSSDESDFAVSIDVDPKDMGRHHLDALLDYILERCPDAEVAIASDTDLHKLMESVPEGPWNIDSIPDLLAIAQPEIEVVGDLIGRIKKQIREDGPSSSERASCIVPLVAVPSVYAETSSPSSNTDLAIEPELASQYALSSSSTMDGPLSPRPMDEPPSYETLLSSTMDAAHCSLSKPPAERHIQCPLCPDYDKPTYIISAGDTPKSSMAQHLEQTHGLRLSPSKLQIEHICPWPGCVCHGPGKNRGRCARHGGFGPHNAHVADLWTHLRNSHFGFSWTCSCGKTFGSQAAFKNHARRDQGTNDNETERKKPRLSKSGLRPFHPESVSLTTPYLALGFEGDDVPVSPDSP